MWSTTPQPCSTHQSSNSRDVLQASFSKALIRILWHTHPLPLLASSSWVSSLWFPSQRSNFYTNKDWISQNWQLLMQTLIHAPLITLIRVCNSYISSKQLAWTSVLENDTAYRSHLWGTTIHNMNMPKTPVHGFQKVVFFLCFWWVLHQPCIPK